MPKEANKHPIIKAIAYLAIGGGLIVLLLSLVLLHGTLQKQSWQAAAVTQSEQATYYQVGEKRYHIQQPLPTDHNLKKIYYNPEQPSQYVADIPSYWWHLYLTMAGLIVFYAGLHLRQERNRNIQSLGFE